MLILRTMYGGEINCDAAGVLPPISRLTPEMAGCHFLPGFTAKVAGTEEGTAEPQPTCSDCFGAPFMPRDPARSADMLAERLRGGPAHRRLVTTGWSGGPYGQGKRMRVAVTRNLLRAALEGALGEVTYAPHAVVGVLVPGHCPRAGAGAGPARRLDGPGRMGRARV